MFLFIRANKKFYENLFKIGKEDDLNFMMLSKTRLNVDLLSVVYYRNFTTFLNFASSWRKFRYDTFYI